MILLAHIAIALISLLWTTFAFFAPSKPKVHISEALIASTLISGTYLVVSTKANMIHSCAMGLVYLAIVSYGLAKSYVKLAAQTKTI